MNNKQAEQEAINRLFEAYEQMMDCCKNHRLPAAHDRAWDQVKNAWEEYIKNMGRI